VKHRILVVEDNPLNSELLREWLEVEGYEALLAASLSALSRFDFGIIQDVAHARAGNGSAVSR
jgi:CheY-like chemotaxis protein